MRTLPSFAVLALLAGLAPAARAETRIGIVDFQRAGEECDEGKAMLAALKKEIDEKQKQLDVKQTEFQTLQADFEKQQALLNEQTKQAKMAELEKRAAELRQMFMQLNQEVSQRQGEAVKGMSDRVKAVVKEIADGEGLQMVIDRGAVVYASSALDITNEVIRKYNVRFPRKADAEPVPASGKKPDGKKPDAEGKKPDAKPKAGGK